jgi:antibiotic biosynthesis monooxygenase (ABM) superfamily enzyme
MILFTVLTPAVHSWPVSFRVLLLNFLGVAALTFFMMPITTRLLSGWLRRERPQPGRDLVGTLLIFAILGGLAGLFYFLF